MKNDGPKCINEEGIDHSTIDPFVCFEIVAQGD